MPMPPEPVEGGVINGVTGRVAKKLSVANEAPNRHVDSLLAVMASPGLVLKWQDDWRAKGRVYELIEVWSPRPRSVGLRNGFGNSSGVLHKSLEVEILKGALDDVCPLFELGVRPRAKSRAK